MPRQFSFRGDRLAFSWGIVLLAGIAFGLLFAFNGDTHALIPLYSVGVFVCFTLSQTGMVRHWLAAARAGLVVARDRERVRRSPDAGRARGRGQREVPGWGVARARPDPGAGAPLPVHPRAVRDVHAGAGAAPGPGDHPAAPRGAGRRPDQRAEPVGRPGRQRGTNNLLRRARCPRRRRPRLRRACPRPVDPPDARRRARRRGVTLPRPDRPVPRLPGRPRPGLDAGQGRPDHVRRDPRVRPSPLVGADPLQPVDQPAPAGAPRPAEHGHHQRPLSARGAIGLRATGSPRCPSPAPSRAQPHRRSPRPDGASCTAGRRWYRSPRRDTRRGPPPGPGTADPEVARTPWPTSPTRSSPASSSR